ncbi:hypothetical protein EWM64_g9946 [Hericium alpestre]|uniref:Uncharacterized protein n=1 Tax=Hericium alpestre TaxID=135208 RepID=A0A4Y9ZJ50_9AGAM|nr:hypothetical protein EWM64_g9946 [Hericium alpestre]
MLYSDRDPISAVGHPGDVWVSKGADKGVWVKTGGFAGNGQWETWGGNETQFQHPTFPDYVLWFQHERWVWVHLNSLEGRRARWRRGKNLGGAWMMERGRFVEESCRQRRVQRAVLGTALDAIEQWSESQQEKAQKRELSDDSELEATPPPKRSRVDDTAAASVGRVAASVDVLLPTGTPSQGLGEPPTPSSSTNLNDVISTPAEFTSDPSPPSISPPEDHGGMNNDHGRSEPPPPYVAIQSHFQRDD